MLNTFEKTKAHEARREAIQRQMEAMEAAASSRTSTAATAPAGQSGTTRRRVGGAGDPAGQAQGSLETARRFLWDEDEEEAASARPTSGVTAATKGDDRRNIYSPDTPASSAGGFFGAIGALFGGEKAAAAAAESKRTARVANISAESQKHAGSSGEDTYHPSFLTSCYIFFRRLMLRLALSMGSCLTWIRTRWAMATGNGRGRRMCLALTIILLVVIPVAIFAPGVSDNGQGSSLSSSQRYDLIAHRVVNSGLTPLDTLTRVDSPQKKALDWIVAEDPAQLDPDDAFILPRYSLAVFYFSTHGNEMFQVATINITQDMPSKEAGGDAAEEVIQPPPEGETTTMGDELAAQPNWVRESGWLSGQGYCSWFGVECHHREGTSIYNTRYDDNNGLILLNMTENNVRGKVPREIFLANPDIRWFSLSGNGFFGEIPAEIGTLTQMRKLICACFRVVVKGTRPILIPFCFVYRLPLVCQ